MALHRGRSYREGDVSIGPAVRPLRSATTAGEIDWYSQAAEREDTYYFSVFEDGASCRRNFLHDIGAERTGDALIGYSLFEAKDRGRGVGATALRLLQRYIAENTELEGLFIITSSDNAASRRIAENCGFAHVGSPREDPNGILLSWKRSKRP